MVLTHSIYRGQVFHIEAITLDGGVAPAEEWLDSLSLKQQQKFASLFKLLANAGKLWNERKFNILKAPIKFLSSRWMRVGFSAFSLLASA